MYKLYSAEVDYRYTHQKFLPAIPIAPKKREDIHEVALFVTSNSYLISKKYIPRLLLIPNVFPRIKKAAIITIQPHPPFGDCLSVIISSIFFILSIVSGLPLTMADCCYTTVASLGRSGGPPRVSPFWGETIWLLYLVPIIYLDRERTQFPAKTFFWSSLLDQKPTQFSAKTFFPFFLVFTYF